jgi:SUMO ligase MMS21 Smc5/6 complex component
MEPKPSEKLLADLLAAAKNYNFDEMDIVMNNLNARRYREQNDLVKELGELARDFKYDDIIEKLKDLVRS